MRAAIASVNDAGGEGARASSAGSGPGAGDPQADASRRNAAAACRIAISFLCSRLVGEFQTYSAVLSPRQESQTFEELDVLLILEQGAVQRGHKFVRIPLPEGFWVDIFRQEKFQPVQQFGR